MYIVKQRGMKGYNLWLEEGSGVGGGGGLFVTPFFVVAVG